MVAPGPSGVRELLFRHPFFWEKRTRELRGGWPFLFPVCGRLEREGEADTYREGNALYRMPIHGFGPRATWTVLDTGRPDELVLQLFDTDTTRARFPYSFEVSLRYRVENGALSCRLTCRNLSPRPLPWYAGFHPYFLTPPPGQGKEDVRLQFQPVRRLRYNERLTGIVGEGPLPAMPLRIGDPGVNETLYELGAEREVRLLFPDGMVVHLATGGTDNPGLFPYLQLYTLPDEPFVCVEPWMGTPNALNRPGASRTLAPGGVERAELRLWVTREEGN
jgi:galactose mutarotase-like enzyme